MNATVSRICTDECDISRVKSIISETFDCKTFMEEFFDLNISKSVFAVGEEEICACGILITSGTTGYLYAVCVALQHRKKGYFKQLCRDIIEYGADKYERIFLVPSSDDLFRTYMSFGFSTELFCECYDTSASEFVRCDFDYDFYNSYSERVDFVIGYDLLKLYLKYSDHHTVHVKTNGNLIGYGIVDERNTLLSFYPLNGKKLLPHSNFKRIALSIDYNNSLEKFTDGVYIN